MSGILGFFSAALGRYVQVSDTHPLPVTGGGGSGGGLNTFTISQTLVAVSAANTPLVAANASRKSLKWMVIGAADVTVAPGTTCAVGVGMIYQAGGAGDGHQGSSEDFPNGCPTNAFACAAAAGTKILVWEGA